MHDESRVADAYRQSFGTLCEGTVERLLLDTSGLRHLDVGCGAGTLAARAASLGREVVAVDADPGMVAVAAEVVPRRLMQGALPDLPFRDDEFDVVTANFVVNHVADPRAAMRELARVTRPGGSVAATIWPARPSAWGTRQRSAPRHRASRTTACSGCRARRRTSSPPRSALSRRRRCPRR